MTLFRQLIIAVVVLFVTLYTVNISVSVKNNRTLVSEQMKTHAQDTATSLGLSMAQVAAAEDNAALETMFNAISDSGYFQRIIFTGLDGKAIIDRKFTVKISGVPDWFIKQVELPAYEGVTEVNSGWQQIGTLKVVSHPGQSYLRLWEITLRQLIWFAVVTAIVCILSALGLHWLLGPLQRVEAQADAIVERRFELQAELPRTRELRKVVEAMNRMSSRLSNLFNEQVDLIAKLREQATQDTVTQLLNRAAFDLQLSGLVSVESGSRSVALLIISVEDIQAINDYAGREEGNAVLVNVGLAITDAINQLPGSVIARRQGADFAILLPDIDYQQAEQIAINTFDQVKGVTWQHNETKPLIFHMGFTYSEAIDEPVNLLREADVAIKKAITIGPNQWCRYDDVGQTEAPVLSKPSAEWQAYLETCIAERSIVLQVQPIFNVSSQELVASEAFVRFESDGNLLPAGVVVPVAERLGLMPTLEKLIIELALERLGNASTDLILNLSSVSLRSEGFLNWLDEKLESSDNAKHLHFEVSEHTMQTCIHQVETLNKILFAQGSRLGVDHFGLATSSFPYLSRLSLHYLKVHRSFASNLSNNSDNQFYIQMLGNLAKSLDIEIWVEGIETQEDFNIISSLNTHVAQGYFLGAPE